MVNGRQVAAGAFAALTAAALGMHGSNQKILGRLVATRVWWVSSPSGAGGGAPWWRLAHDGTTMPIEHDFFVRSAGTGRSPRILLQMGAAQFCEHARMLALQGSNGVGPGCPISGMPVLHSGGEAHATHAECEHFLPYFSPTTKASAPRGAQELRVGALFGQGELGTSPQRQPVGDDLDAAVSSPPSACATRWGLPGQSI